MLENLLAPSHPSPVLELFQENSYDSFTMSTEKTNGDDDGSAEAVGGTPQLPHSDTDLNAKLGLCDHLISLSSHPHFTQRCVEANLPSNLLHCMRIMAMVEYEVAKPWEGNGTDEKGIYFSPVALELFSNLTKSVTSRLVGFIHPHVQHYIAVQQIVFCFPSRLRVLLYIYS